MGKEEQGLSLAAYARHRGITKQAVAKEAKRGRLKACIRLVEGRPRIFDVGAADREWEAGSRRPAAVASRPTSRSMKNSFWIFRAGGAVRMLFIEGDSLDPANDSPWAFTPDCARSLGTTLIEVADQAGDDPGVEKWFAGAPLAELLKDAQAREDR